MIRLLGRKTSGNVQKVLFLLEELDEPRRRARKRALRNRGGLIGISGCSTHRLVPQGAQSFPRRSRVEVSTPRLQLGGANPGRRRAPRLLQFGIP